MPFFDQLLERVDMGCDIHMRIELRTDSAWQAVGLWRELGFEQSDWALRTDFDSYEKYYSGDNWLAFKDELRAARNPNSPMFVNMAIDYTGRSCTLFAAVAGVRNYRDEIIPIGEPRGLPADASTEVRSSWLQEFPDYHSTSYFSLAELTQWDGWEQTFRRELTVAIGREPIRRLSDDELERLHGIVNERGQIGNLEESWDLTYHPRHGQDRALWRPLSYMARLEYHVDPEWWHFLRRVSRLAVVHGLHNVRLVFWFDN